MFVVTVVFTIKPGSAEPFVAQVTENARLSVSLEPGCRRFDVSRSEKRPDEIFLYELYDNEAAFEAHKTMAHYADFSKAVEPLVAAKSVETYTLLNGGTASA